MKRPLEGIFAVRYGRNSLLSSSVPLFCSTERLAGLMHVEIEVPLDCSTVPGQNLAHRICTEKGNEKESRFVLPEKNQKNLLRSIRLEEKHYREK